MSYIIQIEKVKSKPNVEDAMKKRGWLCLAALVLAFAAFALGYFFGRDFHRGNLTIELERRTVELASPELPARQASESDGASLVNINTATVDELCQLNGIGEVLAQRIVDYRQEHGEFRYTDELINVSGIGMATYTQLEPYITVGP